MKTLTIDRNTWVRGGGNTKYGPTCLMNNLGNKCCLGFFALQHTDAKESYIQGIANPDEIGYTLCNIAESDLVRKLPKKITASTLSLRAMDINDENEITEQQREKKLTALFLDYGYEVIFTG